MAAEALSVMPASGRWLRLTVWAPYPDVATRPVQLELRVNGRLVTREMTTPGPLSVFIEASVPNVLVELRASRELMPDRSLQVATQWRQDLPHDATEDMVVR
jgi:hypothetical protein